MMNRDELLKQLGVKLRVERKRASLSQDALAKALGHAGSASHAYVSKLEQGKFGEVGFLMLIRYLQVCKAPIGKFMLELAQSGAFGEAEQGLTVVDDRARAEEAGRAKARARHEKQREREAQDADIIARLWREVMPAIQPLLPRDPTVFLSQYLEGVRAFYRAWKRAVRGALNRDPTLDVQMAFDRVEQAGLEARLVPAAVRKMREIVYDRLMALTVR
jgi:transcriptional regulator with XRE-family HTH domain